MHFELYSNIETVAASGRERERERERERVENTLIQD
jgi:hypothetical protein